MLHISEFVRTLCSSVLVVFNNFLLVDAIKSAYFSPQAYTPFIFREPSLYRLNSQTEEYENFDTNNLRVFFMKDQEQCSTFLNNPALPVAGTDWTGIEVELIK